MSIFNKVKNIYYHIPEPILSLGAIIYYRIPEKIRYGSDFQRTLKFLKEKEKCSKKELEEYVDRKLIDTIKHAYYHVPFYKKFYDENGVDISTINTAEDIKKLPCIDKDVVRKNIDFMLADDCDKDDLLYVTTSGSTGNPVGFYQPQSITMIEWAYTNYIWSRVGYKPDSTRLVLRGKKLRTGESADVFFDPLRRELSCNIFNMTAVNMEKYCVAIEKYHPEFVHGYMSAIVMLAKYIEKRGLKHHFKAILATSENIVKDQKDYVEKIFETRIFSFYGHSERLVIAGMCEYSDAYHFEPTYGYVEMIPIDDSNDVGEIVATGFLNSAMPLIRYKTGDIGRISQDESCSCGRSYFTLDSIEGRWHQDMLINNEGVYVSLTALNIHSKEFDNIVRYKFIQNEIGVVTMQIQASTVFTEEDMLSIRKMLMEKTNSRIDFRIVLVENIPVSKNGKYRIVEQNIKEQ